MKYYSLNHKAPAVDFREAAIRGQAPDKGLYFPEFIPRVPVDIIHHIDNYSNEEIAFQVIKPFTGSCIDEARLQDIVAETVNFPIPLVPVSPGIFSLELFHGPTLAFKDVGARFMSRCLSEFIRQGAVGGERIVVLVATSGDTGGAVASGFLGVEGVDVVILFPKGKVSPVQRLQLTSQGKNIHALEVEGSFDDCQAMVKEAFMDDAIRRRFFLTSANSINVARWLPQQFYYFFAHKQWAHKEQPPVICVPSGNFGNICAGMLAAASGLPVSHFIAACNVNDTVVDYLSSASYHPKKAVPTYSNAMDVGDPSNFIRILELFSREHKKVVEALSAVSVSDDDTFKMISIVFKEFNYMLDPHGAVGYAALQQYLNAHPGMKGIFLETAHPVKFPAVVEAATGASIPVPDAIRELEKKEEVCTGIDADFSVLKDYLLHF